MWQTPVSNVSADELHALRLELRASRCNVFDVERTIPFGCGWNAIPNARRLPDAEACLADPELVTAALVRP